MLVSPAEPAQFKSLGKSSPLPEKYGVDFLMLGTPVGIAGIQRKTITDLLASVFDGRLQRELSQMASLDIGMLLLEGVPQWTTEGYLLAPQTWTIKQHIGLLWSIQLAGYWYISTQSPAETYETIKSFESWLAKDNHSGLKRRHIPTRDVWGTKDNTGWQSHLLQSFPGIGPAQADAIIEKFGGLPLRWTVDDLDLQQVKGIGVKKAEQLWKCLNNAGYLT